MLARQAPKRSCRATKRRSGNNIRELTKCGRTYCRLCYLFSSRRELLAKSGYMYYRCRSCRHLFVWPMPEGARQIYSRIYFEGGGHGFGYPDYDRDNRRWRPHSSLSRSDCRVSGRTGHAVGYWSGHRFLYGMARARGWSVSGVEVSDHASQTPGAEDRRSDGSAGGTRLRRLKLRCHHDVGCNRTHGEPARDVTKSAPC